MRARIADFRVFNDAIVHNTASQWRYSVALPVFLQPRIVSAVCEEGKMVAHLEWRRMHTHTNMEYENVFLLAFRFFSSQRTTHAHTHTQTPERPALKGVCIANAGGVYRECVCVFRRELVCHRTVDSFITFQRYGRAVFVFV